MTQKVINNFQDSAMTNEPKQAWRTNQTYFTQERLSEFTSGHVRSDGKSDTPLQCLYKVVARGPELAGDRTRFIIFYVPRSGQVFYEWFPLTKTFADVRQFLKEIAPDLLSPVKIWDPVDIGEEDFADSEPISSVHARAVEKSLSTENAGSGFRYTLEIEGSLPIPQPK
jgi:hypothetical protein